MRRWKWLGVVAVITVLALTANVAQATPSWGLDNGSEFEIAPTDNGGTSYASIDAAVTAGIGVGRTTMQFQGTWSGINETIDLRNNNLTFQGAAGSSMAWASGTNAFGLQNNASFTAALKQMNVTTDAGAVTWTSTANGSHGSLTVEDCTIDAGSDAISLRDGFGGMSWIPVGADVTVRDSLIKSSGGSGILLRHNHNGAGKAYVSDSRVEAAVNGIKVYPGNVAGAVEYLVVERCEVVSNSDDPAGGATGVFSNNFQLNPGGLTIIDTLVAGFDRGVYASSSAGSWATTNGGYLVNNTVVDNQSTGIMAVSSKDAHRLNFLIINNIIAGSTTGMQLSETSYLSTLTVRGDNNAFFDNTTDTVAAANTSFLDNGRLDESGALAGYTVANTFIDPAGGNYRLAPGATALIDAGEQFSTGVLGGTSVFVDYNNNGTYEDGTDYIIDLGGGLPTVNTNLLLVDADYDLVVVRLQNGVIEIGAYEGAGAAAPVAEPGMLGLVGMALVALRRRRS